MAHFYGNIDGSANSSATRCGTKESGLNAHIRGWNIGVQVRLVHVDGQDIIEVFETNGSNDPLARDLVYSRAKEVK